MNDIRPIRAKRGTNQEGAGVHNRRVIMEALRFNRQLSRAELARATALTKQAVSNIVEELERDGLVAPLEAVRNGRGQPSIPYRLVPEGAYAIGLQIDRHITRAIAVDLVGNVLVRRAAKLPPGGPATGVKTVLDLVEQTRGALAAISPHSEERLVGLGAAMPGPFGLKTVTDDAWMMSAWQNFPLLETLAVGTGLDVALQNDAAAAATAEMMIGAANGIDHAVCIYLGYGLGAGLILDGDLYRGANGNAGEIGMILTAGAGEGLSPLEHRTSIASLCKKMDIDPSIDALSDRITDAVSSSDPHLLGWVQGAVTDLRMMIQMSETIFDPQTVILCGSLPEALAQLLVQSLHPLFPSIAERHDRILPRLLLGFTDPWTVAIGAAADPIRRTFDPRFSAILKTRGSIAV